MYHQGPIAGIACGGDFVATAGYDNKLILWDARQRKALSRACHDHLVNHCAFSADGQWLVSASSDRTARVWELPSLRLHAVLTGHDDDVDMALFSPDCRYIVTCALDRCVRVFNREGRCLYVMHGHTGNVLSLAWMRDSRHVVSTSVDGTVRTWDAERGVQVKKADLGVRTDSVEIGPDGVIYAGDDRGRIAVIRDGEPCYVQAHCAGIKKIVLDAGQGVLVALSYDRSMSVWRLGGTEGLKEIGRSGLPETVWARAATILGDGRIATGTFGATYAIFDLASGIWDLDGVVAGTAINAVIDANERIYSVGDAGAVRINGSSAAEMGSLCNFLVSAGDRVFTGGQLGRLFDADTGEVLYEHRSPLNCGIGFTRQGTPHLAVGSYTGEILIFMLAPDGRMMLTTEISVYENAVKGLSCCDGLLFSVCASTDVAWHRTEDWSLAKYVSKAHERIANACCALGNGTFASVGRDRSLRIWVGETVDIHDSPHANSIKCMAANEDRSAILTGSYGGTLALFDLAERRWTVFHRPTMAGISAIAWDRTGRRFLAASYDGHLYPVPA